MEKQTSEQGAGLWLMEISSLQLVKVCVSIQTRSILHVLCKTWCLCLLCTFCFVQYFKYNPKLYVLQVQYYNTGCSLIIKYDNKEGRLGCKLASQAQALFCWQLCCYSNCSLLFWTADALKLTFPLALQSDQRCAHLCVCHGLPHSFLPSPCLWAPLSAHDKKMHGNRHQAIWHVFVCRECRVRNSISRSWLRANFLFVLKSN